jgi:hypothetical protein
LHGALGRSSAITACPCLATGVAPAAAVVSQHHGNPYTAAQAASTAATAAVAAAEHAATTQPKA